MITMTNNSQLAKSTRFSILLFCVSGLALSVASLQIHFSTSLGDYCTIGHAFNCDIVNRSKYSLVIGIPVALIGVVGYSTLLALTAIGDRRVRTVRLVLALSGLAFALYLTAIEVWVLHTWCILCLGSLLAIAGISLLAGSELKTRANVGV
jgi:uncharacterized membrane protein